MTNVWRRASLSSISALALLFGGCPKRQGPTRIVFVPAPPPQASAAPAESAQVLVIEEPAPIETEPATPPQPQVTEQTPPTKSKSRPRPGASVPPEDTPGLDATQPPPAEVPALEPRESTEQATALRQEIQRLQDEVRQRLGHINEARLNENDRKTLDDARTFFAQSTHAVESGDLQRALNLARKASLLIAALQ